MPWPQLTDYQEAIQAPERCFDDPELRRGRPLLDALGLPRPATGGFASVYRLDCGDRRFAVRCFSRPVPDIEARYARISEHLRRVRLPFMVLFELLPRGIRVRGAWYPIVKMEWVDGDPLHVFLERHLHDPASLRALAGRFARLCAELERAQVAHGDLQHGNILVAGNELKLIDYDGMYVPALAGQPSPELGHRNYQHPRRTARDFGPHLDRFSAWVIYASLVALSAEPGLWARAGGGDECLLFRREDFECPAASPALAALAGLADARLQALAATLTAAAAASDLARLPSLGQRPSPAPARPAAAAPLPDWLRPHLGGGAAAAAGHGPPAWVVEQLDHAPAVRLSSPVGEERRLLVAALLAVVAVAGEAQVGVLAAPVAAAVIAVGVALVLAALAWRYRTRPEVGRKAALRAEHRRLRQAGRRGERRQRALAAALQRLERAEARAVGRLTPRLERSQRQEREALARIDERLAAATTRLAAARQAVREAELTELERRLRAAQARHLRRYLAGQWLLTATIPGLDVALKARLLAAGILTAADIAGVRIGPGGEAEIDLAGRGPVRVAGFGPVRVAALAAWRRQVEAAARATLPAALPPEQEAELRARYLRRREAIDRREAAAVAEARQQADQVRLARGAEQAELERRLQAVRAEHAARRGVLQHEAAEIERELVRGRWRQAEIDQALAAYDGVTVARYVRRLLCLPGAA
jgi:hypothetical protein